MRKAGLILTKKSTGHYVTVINHREIRFLNVGPGFGAAWHAYFEEADGERRITRGETLEKCVTNTLFHLNQKEKR